MTEDKLITIAKFDDFAQASFAKQLLADFGLEAVIAGENAANIYNIPALAHVELQVFQSRSAEAIKILESQKTKEEQ